MKQRTLQAPLSWTGVGIHSGESITMTASPIQVLFFIGKIWVAQGSLCIHSHWLPRLVQPSLSLWR